MQQARKLFQKVYSLDEVQTLIYKYFYVILNIPSTTTTFCNVLEKLIPVNAEKKDG
jgi:hypothetical protein